MQTRKALLQAEITRANAFISDPNVKLDKYNEMKISPFHFYRATAHLYYTDMHNQTICVPTCWKAQPYTSTWLCGDYHTQNIGFFDNDKGKVIFDLNDGDDAYIGPFYWDLLRFSVSIYLMLDEHNKHANHGEQNKHGHHEKHAKGNHHEEHDHHEGGKLHYSNSQKKALTTSFLQEYEDMLLYLREHSIEKQIKIDKSHIPCSISCSNLEEYNNQVNTFLKKQTSTTERGQRHFDPKNDDLRAATSDEWEQIENNWTKYQQKIPHTFTASKKSNYFTIKDIARCLNIGLGSRGVERYYILIQGDDDTQNGNQILDLKEQRRPSMFCEGSIPIKQYTEQFKNDAKRSLAANKALTAHTDDHMGIMEFHDKSFLVRRISPFKSAYPTKDLNHMHGAYDFVKYAAQALALAHTRAYKHCMNLSISYSFAHAYEITVKAWPDFKTTLINLAENYHDQVLADHDNFVQLVYDRQIC